MAEEEKETPPEEEGKPKEETSSEEEEKFEPPVRQTAKPELVPSGDTPEGKRFWYELRKINERIDKIEAGGFSETDLDEEKRSLRASEEVDEKFSSFLEELDKRERQKEYKDFLRDNPDFSKYGKRLGKFAQHPAYQNIPIEFIAKALAFEDAEKIGAKKGKEAEEEARKTKTGGSPFKPSPKEFPDYWGMSKEEFEKETEKVKQKGRE